MHTTGEYSSSGKSGVRLTLRSGIKGYVRRNGFQTNYFQVLAKLESGSIGGWYIREDDSDRIIEVVRPIPEKANPEGHWKAYWNTAFQK